MGKGKTVCFALGGHIATQNASFRRLIEWFPGMGFYGAKNGFEAFDTGETYELKLNNINRYQAGFVAGAGRASLLDKAGNLDDEKIERAKAFFRRGGFNIAVGSGGDDHGKQMGILGREIGNLEVYVLNKTMDNDLGGRDGVNDAPYTDFTNGFQSACSFAMNEIRHHLSGSWTNNVPYLIGLFGRETNWVGATTAYFSDADLFLYGELPQGHKGHSIERIHEAILKAQDENERKFGRKIASVIVPEGTLIQGVEHLSPDLIDAHGHYKLNPEVLVVKMKEELEKRFGMKTQTVGISYEMRNCPPSVCDVELAEQSADALASAIKQGRKGVESTFHIRGPGFADIVSGLESIERVSEKRYAGDYECHHGRRFYDRDSFRMTDEIGKYYGALFERVRKEDILPRRMKLIRV